MVLRAASDPYEPTVVVLASDFPVTSQAALQNVTNFSIVLAAGTYLVPQIVLWMNTNGATNGGWRFGFTYSGTFSNTESFVGGMLTTGGTYNGSFINLNAGTLTSLSNANPDFGQYSGVITTATAGTLQVQFAQNTSNATASTLKAGSALVFERLV